MPRPTRPPVISVAATRRVKYPPDTLKESPLTLSPDLAANCSGKTTGLSLAIGEDGSLKSVKVISASTFPGCDSAALETVRRYQFKPAIADDGKPIEGKLLVSVNF